MDLCPFCGSEYVIFSKKRGVYICEDCGETFEIPRTNGKSLRLFISYGHDKNAVVVQLIKEALEQRGHQVWIDSSKIRSGSDWRERITSGIIDSDRVISFMSRHAVRRPGVCLDELRIALCVRGADIRTILLESEGEVNPPASLSSRQWLDMSEWESRMQAGCQAWDTWFAEKMDQLCDSLESPETMAFAGEIDKLQRLLHPVLYDNRQLNLVNNEFAGRQWLHDAVEVWKNDPKGNQFFCLYGVPGAGKSTFLANLMHYNPDVAASVFFEWDEEQRDSPEAVICSLAFQMAAKIPDYRKQLLYVLSRVKDLDKRDKHELFRLLLAQPLNNCIDGDRATCLIALDALDETGAGMVNFLTDKLRSLPRWVRVIVTSRDEPSIRAALPDAKQLMLDADQADNNRDIQTYIRDRLPEADPKVAEQVALRAEGSFLYAVFYCNGVLAGDIDPDDPAQMPAGLGRFYTQNFSRIFRDPVEFEIMAPMLGMLACRESIPREVVCGALGLNQRDYAGLRRKLGGFVRLSRVTYRYSKEPQFMLRFSHKSLRDWLLAPEMADSFTLDLTAARRLLADYALSRVREDRYWKEKPRRYVGECPKMELDLELDYLQSNLGRFLLEAGMAREFEAFLLEKETPWHPYWYELDRFPAGYPMDALLRKFRGSFEEAWRKINTGHPGGAEDFPDLFDILRICAKTKQIAQVLFEQLVPGRLDNFYRSAASDDYPHRGLPYVFNADKLDSVHAIRQAVDNCRSLGILIPASCLESLERLKLSCLFCEGEVRDMDTIFLNFSYLFRGNSCVVDDEAMSKVFKFQNIRDIRRKFNTYCMEESLRSGCCEEAYADLLVAQGADFETAAQRAVKYLEQMSKQGWNGMVNTTAGMVHDRLNHIEELRNRYAPSKRWHPEPAELVHRMGAMYDYCEVYRFPCCGVTVMTGDGPPSQHRPDGCQEVIDN